MTARRIASLLRRGVGSPGPGTYVGKGFRDCVGFAVSKNKEYAV